MCIYISHNIDLLSFTRLPVLSHKPERKKERIDITLPNFIYIPHLFSSSSQFCFHSDSFSSVGRTPEKWKNSKKKKKKQEDKKEKQMVAEKPLYVHRNEMWK